MIRAHLFSEPDNSKLWAKSTGSDAFDLILKVLLWTAPWYYCLTTLFFAWLIILYPRPTLACSVAAWLFWFTSLDTLEPDDRKNTLKASEAVSTSAKTSEETAKPSETREDGEWNTLKNTLEADAQNLMSGFQMLQRRWSQPKTTTLKTEVKEQQASQSPSVEGENEPAGVKSNEATKPSVTEEKEKTAEQNKRRERLSISHIVTELAKKDEVSSESGSNEIVNAKLKNEQLDSNFTLLDAYLEPLVHLHEYSRRSNTLFFFYLPIVMSILIFCLPTQALFIVLSSVFLAWHSPPLQAVLFCIRRISFFNLLYEKFVIGKTKEPAKPVPQPSSNEPPAPSAENKQPSVSSPEKKESPATHLLKVIGSSPYVVHSNHTNNTLTDKESSDPTEKCLYLIEHQRYWVGVGWLNRTLPTDPPNFTNAGSTDPVAEPTAQLLPPDGLAWIDDKWSISPWTFTDTFWAQPAKTQFRTAFTRSREWRRRYRVAPPAENEKPHTSRTNTASSLSSTSEDQVSTHGSVSSTKVTAIPDSNGAEAL